MFQVIIKVPKFASEYIKTDISFYYDINQKISKNQFELISDNSLKENLDNGFEDKLKENKINDTKINENKSQITSSNDENIKSEELVKKDKYLYYKITFEDIDDFGKFILSCVYYSRLIENIYLVIKIEDELNTQNNNNNIKTNDNQIRNIKQDSILIDTCMYEKIINSYDLKELKIYGINYLVFDLIGFNLSNRDYLLNKNDFLLNPIIANYCFYLLELDKLDSFNIIDPISNLGEIIIEASLFNLRKPLNLQKKYSLPFVKIFNYKNLNPITLKDKNKCIAVVQENIYFKKMLENINFVGAKVKTSQYGLDWLDIKFKGEQIDYCITQLIDFGDTQKFNSVQKEFLYMTEFISKKKICVIMPIKLDPRNLRKYKLKVERGIILNYLGKKHFIYLLNK